MVPTSSPRSPWIGSTLLVALAWFVPSLSAQEPVPPLGLVASSTEKIEDVRRQARAAEKQGDWLKACWRYDEILRRERGNVAAREAYHRCLRRLQITTRHNDRGYRDALASLTFSQALDVYEQVLNIVRPAYVDRDKADLGTLFKHGLTELRFALEDEAFLREHLQGVPLEAIRAFRTKLQEWPARRLASASEARDQVTAVLNIAFRSGIPDRSSLSVAVALEFASGACSGLDEYSLFFNPSHFGDLMASWRGKYAGIGAELAINIDGQLQITHVYPRSPAEEAKLEGAYLLRIDQLRTDTLPAYYAAERLRGEVGTTVELEVVLPGQMEPQVYKLVRRPVTVGTVESDVIAENMMEMQDRVGYLRITSFHKSTLQDVKEALARLQSAGVKGLILDLRGNPGGSFPAAVKVSELFLPEGSLVVLTQGTVKEFDQQQFRVGSLNPFALPMVVLVDGETASAAEVLAGCLKEQGRARIIGQTTFGKGTIQVLIPMDKSPLQKTPGGIRVTVAKFYWPGRNTDGGRGIVPNDFVVPDTGTLISAARMYLRSVAGMMPMAGNNN